jgi:hypothetical protein
MAKFPIDTSGPIGLLRCSFSVMAILTASAVLAAEPKVLVVNEIQVTDAEKYKGYTSQVTFTPFKYLQKCEVLRVAIDDIGEI